MPGCNEASAAGHVATTSAPCRHQAAAAAAAAAAASAVISSISDSGSGSGDSGARHDLAGDVKPGEEGGKLNPLGLVAAAGSAASAAAAAAGGVDGEVLSSAARRRSMVGRKTWLKLGLGLGLGSGSGLGLGLGWRVGVGLQLGITSPTSGFGWRLDLVAATQLRVEGLVAAIASPTAKNGGWTS
jgi:hypothetical protein